MGRFFAGHDGPESPRVCKNADTVWKSASLRRICQHLASQQTLNLRRNAIFVLVLTVKPALKRFYIASTQSCPPGKSAVGQFQPVKPNVLSYGLSADWRGWKCSRVSSLTRTSGMDLSNMRTLHYCLRRIRIDQVHD